MEPSQRILRTDAPVIGQMNEVLKDAPKDAVALSQGIVFWGPPAAAIENASKSVSDHSTSAYCGSIGLPVLQDALKKKLAAERSPTRLGRNPPGGGGGANNLAGETIAKTRL